VALSAAPLAQDAGLVQPILDELDQALTGADVELQMRSDGRVNNIGLEAFARQNPRYGYVNETLRLMVSRAFAGLDLQLPDDETDTQWAQYQSWLMKVPTVDGTAAGIELVNEVKSQDDQVTRIVSSGRGMLVPGDGLDKYDTKLASDAVFDRHFGRISDRSWTLMGTPTSSSAISQGSSGFAYVQQGHLMTLLGRDMWDVGESKELPPLEDAPTALQPGSMGGPIPR
jgi:hypothetical protein